MSINVKKNVLIVDDEELDIYIADELKNAFLDLYKGGKKKVSLDLAKVERLSTPAVQVIISARRSFKELKIVNGSDSIFNDLKNIGAHI